MPAKLIKASLQMSIGIIEGTLDAVKAEIEKLVLEAEPTARINTLTVTTEWVDYEEIALVANFLRPETVKERRKRQARIAKLKQKITVQTQ